MQWYYVENNQQAGPVEETEFPRLIQAGRLRADTLVWHEGMTNWEPFKTVGPPQYTAAFNAPAAGVPPIVGIAENQALCAECGKVFNKEDMIPHGTVHICSQCKPIFMQKLAEGVTVPRFADGNLTEQQILEREYRIDIGGTMSRSWEGFKKNAGITIVTCLVMFILLIGFGLVGGLVSLIIPFGNALLGLLYTVPIFAGVYWFMLRAVRGDQPIFSDSFFGFRSHYARLVVLGLIQFACNLICFIPLIVMGAVVGLSTGLKPGAPPNISGGMLAAFAGVGLLAVCAWIYVYLHLMFAALLIVDKKYPAWAAVQLSRKMVHRRWWMTFAFSIIAGLLMFLGGLACLVGLLVSAPFSMGMKSALYDDNFRDLKPYA